MNFVLSFIPLFVAIDVIGVLPIYAGLTQAMAPEDKLRTVRVACLTALVVSVLFMFLGDAVFRVLEVTADDFRMAGGLLLLVFAIQDLIIGGKPRRAASATVAVVPLGMPLIVGPGVLTTLLLVVVQYGYSWTLAALAANLAIVYITLRASDRILRLVGPGVTVAAAKIASLFLAAIGVKLLRIGLENTLAEFLSRK